VTSPDPARKEQGHRWPEMLPDGNSITKNFGASDAELGVLSIKTRTWHTILSNASKAHYVPTGHLVYAHAGTLMAVPFDLKSLSVTGPPVQVVHEVLTDPDDGYGGMAVARSENLVYVRGPERTDRGASTRLVWVSREPECIKRRQRLLVIAPIMIQRYAVFDGDPAEVILHNIRLLDRKEDKRFEQSSSPMKTRFAGRFRRHHY